MIEIKVKPDTPSAITAAFKNISNMLKTGDIAKDTEIHMVLMPGIYREILSYNLSNPILIEARPGSNPEKTVLMAENCEAFHKDTENRSVFVFGPNCTRVSLKGFTIENTHVKTHEDAALGNQAEALCWHNQKGTLTCEDMHFISRQDTIHVKGKSFFIHCTIVGDVDYIWGYCETCLLDNCLIHTREDNRAGVRDAYVLQSRAVNGKPGFIFNECTFTADKRPKGSRIFIARSSGTGKPDSVDRWDSIALINCTVSELYDDEFWTDEDGRREVFPAKGTAHVGWREYGTKKLLENGQTTESDFSKRAKYGYILSDEEFQKYYAFPEEI